MLDKSILFLESILSKGKGVLSITGNWGKVMKESATIAMEYIKSNADLLGVNSEVFSKYNVHIHVPEGATPKDGPSAGITMASALLSLVLNKKIKANYAMTGEMTLTGYVLAVGGIREKVIAAKREGIHQLILPESVKANYIKLPAHVKKGLIVKFVDHSRIFVDHSRPHVCAFLCIIL